jgi:hypothetical protein
MTTDTKPKRKRRPGVMPRAEWLAQLARERESNARDVPRLVRRWGGSVPVCEIPRAWGRAACKAGTVTRAAGCYVLNEPLTLPPKETAC